MTPSRLLASCVLLIAAILASPVFACPAGSQFFAYGGAGGCVEPGSNKVVQKCFNMGKVCPSGWSNEGASDTGSWCCPPGAIVAERESCVVRGTSPFCDGQCLAGEYYKKMGVEAGQRCLTGQKNVCCHTVKHRD
jgi:hypothetical protein